MEAPLSAHVLCALPAPLIRNRAGYLCAMLAPSSNGQNCRTFDRLSRVRVIDDWPEVAAIFADELDVIETYLAPLLDELLGAKPSSTKD